MKWVDGELVDNPDAEWAITDATREMLRQTIADGLDQNLGADAISDAVSKSYAFSQDRAELITHTEVARANSQGALEGAREAADNGVVLQKVWLLGPNACEICQENADDGPIGLEDSFSSGDDAPPQHPNCYCSVSWEVE
jgi:hypothetical protein